MEGMWDARFEAIRDRKLNELVIFSAMIRTEPSKRSEYLGLIRDIGRDLDVIDALIEGRKVPESEPIESELYRGRLSKMELLDEYCLDQFRHPDPEMKAPESTKAVGAPEEVARIASPPEVPKVSAPETQQSIEPPEEPMRIKAADEVQRIQSADEPEKIEKPEDIQRISPAAEPEKIDKPEETPRIKPQKDTKKKKGKAKEAEKPKEEEPKAAPDDSTFDMIVSLEDAILLKKVRQMKDEKIDYFIEAELDGHFNDDACEDVIMFLKTDLALIDKILSINVTSRSDIESKIREIVAFVEAAEEPKHQKMYMNSLDYKEKEMEADYNKALKRLDEAIAARYPDLLGGSDSAFFQ